MKFHRPAVIRTPIVAWRTNVLATRPVYNVITCWVETIISPQRIIYCTGYLLISLLNYYLIFMLVISISLSVKKDFKFTPRCFSFDNLHGYFRHVEITSSGYHPDYICPFPIIQSDLYNGLSQPGNKCVTFRVNFSGLL